MDVIAGFATETDEQFESTYKVLSETPWTRLHVFPYSERAGTKAVQLPQVPFSLRKERAARLRELSLHRHQSEALKQRGQVKSILTLNSEGKRYDGLSADYWSVKLTTPATQKNLILDVEILDVQMSQSEIVLVGRQHG